jgi:hypothetical protein
MSHINMVLVVVLLLLFLLELLFSIMLVNIMRFDCCLFFAMLFE